jgi:PAS domain S-box-containing protein
MAQMHDEEGRTRGAGDALSVLADKLIEGYQVVDERYRYLYVNAAVAGQGRSTPEALRGRTMMEAYPGIEHSEMFTVLRRCMEQRTAAQVENEFEFPDGTKAWFQLHFEPVPEGIAILSVDITERLLSEAALRRSMRALTTLSRCNHTLVRAKNERQFVQDVCRIVAEAGGYPMAWIGFADTNDRRRIRRVAAAGLSNPGADFTAYGPAALESHRLPAAVAMRTGVSVVAALADIDPEDDPVTRAALERGLASCIALPIFDRDESIGALTIYGEEPEAFDDAERALLEEVAMDLGYGTTTLRDRVTRERGLAALAEAEAKTRAIYDHLPNATFVWRSDDEGFALVDFNEAAREATAGAVSGLIGSPPSALGAVPGIEDDLRLCLEQQQVVRREVECTLRGGTDSVLMAVTYGFIPPDMVLMHGEDITQQRRIQEQLLAAQRLEAIGRLAGGVAHDFNNLLSVILSYADLALEQIDSSTTVRTAITQMRAAGERAATLTEQLLAFSRKQVLEPEVSNLNGVVRGIEGMLRRLLGADIDIEIELAADLGNVSADPGRLEQVIMNLAVNARDAMPGGGKLTIATANVDDRDAQGGESQVVLSVTDTGCGMDAETRARIFEPFFTTKGQSKGTGLGLSTAYGIITQSGGDIDVHSELGQGTTFSIRLPRVAKPMAERPREAVERVTGTGGETVLVVEDQDALRTVAERILKRAGYQVLTASSGAEALRIAAGHGAEIDLLLTDIVMPGMSGHALAERLKRARPEVEVLFTSGYSERAIEHQGALAPDGFIGKPFSAADLLRKVRETLDRPFGARRSLGSGREDPQ